MDEKLKGVMKMSLNSISPSDDPTIVEAIFVVHDFLVSGNREQISEDVAREHLSTLINKPITCHYVKQEDNYGYDGLKGHEDTTDVDRVTGDEIQYQDTISVGVITDVWITEGVMSNGELGNVVYCKSQLWKDKYRNIIGLLTEWLEKGIRVSVSVEYLYMNFEMMNKVKLIKAPIIYTGLCLIQSEDVLNLPKLQPSYDSAYMVSLNALNDAVNKDVCVSLNNKNKEDGDTMENVFLKSLNEKSFGDIRDTLYTELSKVMPAAEYYNVWISTWGTFDTYFVYETLEGDSWVNYKVNYAKGENDVIAIDYTSKVKVERQDVWVEVATATVQVENMTTSLNTLTTEKEEMVKSLNEKEVEMESLKEELVTEKATVISLNETITSLNTEIDTLKPYKESVEVAEYEKSLNEKKDFYKDKFDKLGKVDVFESEDIQDAIVKSLNTETKVEAELKINSTLVDLISSFNTQTKAEEEKKFQEPTKSLNSLNPKKDSFYERFGFEK